MQLEHSFTVPVDIATAWDVLLDVERIAPCIPGATIDSVDDDSFTGRVKVKVGPITVAYGGSASFVEKDADSRRVVLSAKGKETRGSGTATATITASLAELAGDDGPAGTKVDVHTDLTITGRPAQFGRGVMDDVGAKLLGQFSDCLAAELTSGSSESATPVESDEPADAAAAPPSAADAEPAEPPPEAINLVSVAGGSVLRRVVLPVLVVILLVVLLVVLLVS